MLRKSGRTLAMLGLIACLCLSTIPVCAALHTSDLADQRTAAIEALAWLKTQQQPDGSFSSGWGSNMGPTCDAALAIVAGGEQPDAWSNAAGSPSVTDYLVAHADDYATDASTTGKAIMALTAAGRDPVRIGTPDLVARLKAYAATPGVYSTGAAGQTWAILALVAARESVPVAALTTLESHQLDSGAWDSGFGPGNDDTCLALQALLAAGESASSERVRKALAFLETQQNEDGGFPYIKPSEWGTDTNASSTALAIQALIAAGENPLAARWTKSGENPLSALLALQAADGRIEFQPGTGNPVMATLSALPGIVGRPFPFAGRAVALRKALDWLHAQQAAGGNFFPGDYSPSLTAQAVAAIAAAGETPAAWRGRSGQSPLDYLATQVHTIRYPGLYGRFIMAVGVSYLNPYDFGGVNLVQAVQASYNPITGTYGTGGYTADHAVVMLGLASAGESVPAGASSWLKQVQNADGGWGWAEGQDSDSNSTSWVIQALLAAGESRDSESLTRALAYLHTLQNGDGGFANQKPAPPWGSEISDGNSTPSVIQGLVALGENVTGWDWTTSLTETTAISMSLHNPIQCLYRFQTAEGGFEYMTPGESDFFATIQAIPAVAEATWPLPSPGVRAASKGLSWLRTQQRADGSFGAGFGQDAGPTSDAALAIVAAGGDPATWQSADGNPSITDYLLAHADEYATDASATGKLIVTLVACGQDPYNVNGLDLVERLQSYATTPGNYAAGAIGQAWGMLALAAVRKHVPVEALVALKSHQLNTGAWDGGWGPDNDATCLALQALAAAGEPASSSAVQKALAFLHTQQNDDGGFPSIKPSDWGTATNANSTASVVMALMAIGENPLEGNWTKGGANPFTALLALQNADGRIEYQPGIGSPLLATTAAIPALLGAKMPLRTLPGFNLFLPVIYNAAQR